MGENFPIALPADMSDVNINKYQQDYIQIYLHRNY
jgi:hypothetical protein